MKFGIRTPRINTRVKAMTTGRVKRSMKRAVNPFYGKKGIGFVKNPSRSMKSAVYHRTTIGVPTPRLSAPKRRKTSTTVKSVSTSPKTSATQTPQGDSVGGCMIFLSFALIPAGLFFLPIGILVSALGVLLLVFGAKRQPKKQDMAPKPSDNEFAGKEALGASQDVVSRHYALLNSENEEYRNKNFDKVETLCKEDIDLYQAFIPAYRSEQKAMGIDNSSDPFYPAFVMLAKVYEKQQRYDEAINICDEGISLNVDDGTKGGFVARKKRMENKK